MFDWTNVRDYSDYKQIKGEDLVAFMKDQPRADVEAWKAFCAEPKYTTHEDGTVTERATNFFEARNWVLQRYFPESLGQKSRQTGNKLLDDIAAL